MNLSYPRPSRSYEKARRAVPVYLMMLPCILLLAVFILYPLCWVLRYTLFQYDGVHSARYIGLDNFIRVFTRDKAYWNSVMNTFLYAVGKLVITLPLSFFLALLLNRPMKGRGLFRGVVFMPTIISTAVMSLVFYFMFNAYNGIVNQIMVRLSLIGEPINWFSRDNAMLTCILVAAWGAIGNYMIYFLAGLQTIPEDMLEAARLDGANSAQVLFHITIPLMGPVMQMVLMLAIVTALKGFESIMVLTGGGPASATNVMYLYVYSTFFSVQGERFNTMSYGYGSAVSIVTAAITGVITLVYLRSSRKLNDL